MMKLQNLLKTIRMELSNEKLIIFKIVIEKEGIRWENN